MLESLLRTAIAGKKVIEEVEGEQQALRHRIFLNGGTFLNVVQVARRKAERIKAEQRAKDALAEIDSIGVQVKDIHWHGTQEGFASRKLIDERIARGKKTN